MLVLLIYINQVRNGKNKTISPATSDSDRAILTIKHQQGTRCQFHFMRLSLVGLIKVLYHSPISICSLTTPALK